MVGSVTSATNHYDTLGLSPGASDDEIRHAFERKMSAFRWHPIGATSQLCIAYETLRDRLRRADYDRALGLVPEPQPLRMTMTVMRRHVDPPAVSPAPPPRAVERSGEPAAEPGAASAIAASLREVARPVSTVPASEPPPPVRERAVAELADAAMERHIQQVVAESGSKHERGHEPEDRVFDWKRPALAVGGFVIAAGLLGALAGFSVKDDAQSAQAEPSVTAKVPQVRPQSKIGAASQPSALVEGEPVHAAPPATSRRRASRQPVVTPAEREAHASAFAQTILSNGQSVEAASDQLAADAPTAAETAPASMPLSDSVIARTIERIGYACGEVSSTAAVDGARGVFSVTCSSGQSYRATPVNGRYHFRRSASH